MISSILEYVSPKSYNGFVAIGNTNMPDRKQIYSLRRRPLADISLDLLRKSQAAKNVQKTLKNAANKNANLAIDEMSHMKHLSDNTIADLRNKIALTEIQLNEARHLYDSHPNTSYKQMQLCNDAPIKTIIADEYIDTNYKDVYQVHANNCDLAVSNGDGNNTVNKNKNKNKNKNSEITRDCNNMTVEIDELLNLTDEQSEIILQTRSSFELIIDQLQADLTSQVRDIEYKCQAYDEDFVIAQSNILCLQSELELANNALEAAYRKEQILTAEMSRLKDCIGQHCLP